VGFNARQPIQIAPTAAHVMATGLTAVDNVATTAVSGFPSRSWPTATIATGVA
jgi:hypothetical protein